MNASRVPAIVLIAFFAPCAVAQYSDNDLIPPEVLKRMDPDIVAGKRPTFKIIRQSDIFGLRDNPRFNVDFVRFSFTRSDLSSVQRDILKNWVRQGHNKIYMYSSDMKRDGWLINYGCSLLTATPPKRRVASTLLKKHPVNTDCKSVSFAHCASAYENNSSSPRSRWGFYYYPIIRGTEPIAIGGKGMAVAGMIRWGDGELYFKNRLLTKRDKGFLVDHPHVDSRRWYLNYWHWAMGLPIPGATKTSTSGGSSPPTLLAEPSKHDSIFLKNGDTLTGDIINTTIKVKTSYASIEFPIKEVAKLVFEGGQQNVDAVQLVTGDKLSGVVETDPFKVKLVAGNEVTIAKDKIKQIDLKKKRE